MNYSSLNKEYLRYGDQSKYGKYDRVNLFENQGSSNTENAVVSSHLDRRVLGDLCGSSGKYLEKPCFRKGGSLEKGTRIKPEYLTDFQDSDCDSDDDFLATEYREKDKPVLENDHTRNIRNVNFVTNDSGRKGWTWYPEKRKKEALTYNPMKYTNIRGLEQKRTMGYFDKPKTTLRELKQSKRRGNIGNTELNLGAYTKMKFQARTTKKETNVLKDYRGATDGYTRERDYSSILNGTTRHIEKPSVSYTPSGVNPNAAPSGKERFCIQTKKRLAEEPTYNKLVKDRVISDVPCADRIGDVKHSNVASLYEDTSRFMPEIMNQLAGNPYIPGNGRATMGPRGYTVPSTQYFGQCRN